MMDPDEISKKMKMLYHSLDDSGEALRDFVVEHLEDICYYLESWDTE